MEIKKQLLVPGFILILILAGYIGYIDAFPFFHAPKINLAKKILEPEDPLVVHFDKSVVQHKTESSFSLDPSVIGNISWQNNDLMFKPLQPWEPGKSYKISLDGMTITTANFSFKDNFSIDTLPQIEKYSPGKEAVVDPGAPIEFYFNRGDKNFRLDLKTAPVFNYTLSIDPERKYFKINPQEPLNQDTEYQIIAYESYQSKDKNEVWYPQEIANFQFKTTSPPELQKIMPTDQEGDVKEFTPFKVFFSKAMRMENWKDFVEINPPTDGSAEWEDNGKTFIFKPYRWNQNTDYSIKIKKGWQAEDNTSLNKDFLASFHSFNTSGLVYKGASTSSPKIKEGKIIDINLSKQLLSIFDSGKNMGNFKVSSGKKGMATPTGMFSILSKQKRRWSKKYHLFMPYWMQFTNQGHGIHELPEWPSGYKEGASHLGIPVSHGCVRLGVGAAETVYHFISVGTPVYIHY